MGDQKHPLQNKPLRILLIVLMVIIAVSTSMAAYLAIRAGHAAKGASTFFAGFTFVVLIATNLWLRR